jgi:dTDP-4-dehydrorhamnose 3,5-epimerase
MQFEPLAVSGSFAVRPEPVLDERGGFARVFGASDFAQRGLVSCFVQQSVSFNTQRGTVRGLHFQIAPFSETKLVRCIRGVVFDVIVDLRSKSPTFRRWCSLELLAVRREAIYIPEGCAHGFQTLVDDCEVEYLITPEYVPSAARGVRWDDPLLAIDWPICTDITISERDRTLPSVDAVPPL